MLFSWKRRRTDPPPTPARINPLPASNRDWTAFENSAGWPSIKVWLTNEVARSLDQLSQYRDQTRSEVMRDLLFIAIYGHFTYAQVLAERRGLLREPGRLESSERVCFDLDRGGRSPDPPRPERKRENVRLFLPEPMRAAIEAMAVRDGSTVSVTAFGLIERMLSGSMPESNAARSM